MFTPQRKSWALSPRVSGDASNPRSVGRSVLGKGKGVAGSSPAETPPPRASLGENRGGEMWGGGEDVDDWRRFRDAGLLDESVLQRKDREALASRILDLENELHEYQYNMGLLLIEKEEWSSQYEEIRLRLLEAEEILKREQAAHIIATSELEKREENLRKALGVEKQCVADLEKALRDMRTEMAEVKFTSDKKMAEAHALDASIEEKFLEVERKIHSADAKLAEASRKSSEIDRKLEDVEARERKVQREIFSLNAERKALEKDIAEQRDHLRAWEKKLQDGQKRLVDGQRFLNEREDRANEVDQALKKKEEELEEARNMIVASTNSLKDKEDDVNTRLRALASKEKDFNAKLNNLEKKEKELFQIEEKLNARERDEIQKLLDDHTTVLDAKKREFEVDLERQRKSFEEEIHRKLDEVDKQKMEISRKEEHVSKREQEMEIKMEKLKAKEKDLDTKSKALRKWESSVKSDEKSLQAEKEKVTQDSEQLKVSRNELNFLMAAMKAEEQQIICEKEILMLTKEEREQHLQLQSKLKQEIEDYMMLKESIAKEKEALREEREKFEREWEALDEKRLALETEVKKVSDESERFEKWRHNEHERLKNEEIQAKAEIVRQLEDLKLKKEAFEKNMEHERLVAREDVERQLADIARELEIRKHDLEMNMQKKQEDVEKRLQEKEKEFEMRRDSELNQITSSIKLNDSKIRKLKVEQDRIDREKEELFIHKKKLEVDQVEIQKDIDTLRVLSKNLKDQRAEFVNEKEQFIAAAERCKTCRNCGDEISELEVLGLQPSRTENENSDVILPSLLDGYTEERLKSMQTMSSPQGTAPRSFGSAFLQKCSVFFKRSPGKDADHSSERMAEQPIPFGERLDTVASENLADHGAADNSFDVHNTEVGGDASNEDLERLDEAGDEHEASLGVGDNSDGVVRLSDYVVRQAEGDPVTASIDVQNETEGSSRPENDSQPQASKQRQRQPRKRGRAKSVKRTHIGNAALEDSRMIQGGPSDLKVGGEPNGGTKDSLQTDEENQGASVHTDQVVVNTRQKRRRPQISEMTTSELEADDGEAQSQSVSMGGRRKRRQTAADRMQTPGDRRYNLRRSTIASSAAASHAASDHAKERKAAGHQTLPDNEITEDDHDGEGTSKLGDAVSPISAFDEQNNKVTHLLDKSTARSVTEVSSKEMVEVYVESSDVMKSMEMSERTVEDGDEIDSAPGTSELATPSGGGSSATEDGADLDDEENVERHDGSIGKKLWSFFTT